MKFEEKLKHLRKERGMTQAELAEQLNVSRQAVSKWETGASIPDIENILSICEVFEVTPNDFFTPDSEKNEPEIPEESSERAEKEKEGRQQQEEQEPGKGEEVSGTKPFFSAKKAVAVIVIVAALLFAGSKLHLEGSVMLYLTTGVIIFFIYIIFRFIFRVLSKYEEGSKKK